MTDKDEPDVVGQILQDAYELYDQTPMGTSDVTSKMYDRICINVKALAKERDQYRYWLWLHEGGPEPPEPKGDITC